MTTLSTPSRGDPFCIFYPDDFALLGGLKAIQERHFKIGEDISIVGYDGILLSSLLHPPLTTYRQDGVSNQYKYTKDIMTDSKGTRKGVSWQACPGGFIFRRSIARDVIGSDKPEDVQKAPSSWNQFDAVAASAHDKGYFMLSGYDDAFRVFSDNMNNAWVEDSTVVIDLSIERWIEQTKSYASNGYNNKANLWSAESFQGAAEDGKSF